MTEVGLSGDQEVSGPERESRRGPTGGLFLSGDPEGLSSQGLPGESGHPGEEEVHHLAVVSFHLFDPKPKHTSDK